MTTLRTAAQQALEALEMAEFDPHSSDAVHKAITALRAALAEHDKNLAWFKERKANWDLQRKLAEETQERDRQQREYEEARLAALAEPVQEPVAWMCSDPDLAEKGYSRFSSRCEGAWNIPVYTSPPQRPAEPVQECPNCASLEAQNTELDRKLADIEQTSLELCNVCGWKTLIPGDCCLNCERKHPLGQASTDVPLTVYSVKKAEPVERKPMNEFDALRLITESIGRLQSAGPVEGLIGIIRAVEAAHGIK